MGGAIDCKEGGANWPRQRIAVSGRMAALLRSVCRGAPWRRAISRLRWRDFSTSRHCTSCLDRMCRRAANCACSQSFTNQLFTTPWIQSASNQQLSIPFYVAHFRAKYFAVMLYICEQNQPKCFDYNYSLGC